MMRHPTTEEMEAFANDPNARLYADLSRHAADKAVDAVMRVADLAPEELVQPIMLFAACRMIALQLGLVDFKVIDPATDELLEIVGRVVRTDVDIIKRKRIAKGEAA